MEKLTIDQVQNFALQNDIHLNEEELQFTYQFVKKNWEIIFQNPNLLQLDRFKDRFSEENFPKIQKLIQFYYQKYGYLL